VLNSFVKWARQVSNGADLNVDTKVTEGGPSDNLSARLDVDTPSAVGRITFWESGDYDAEVIDIQSELTSFSMHGHLQEGCSFWEEFSSFLSVLGLRDPEL
jgi:hypothetical protein